MLCIGAAIATPTLLTHGLSSTPPTLPTGAPPAEVWQTGSATLAFPGNIFRESACSVTDKSVTFLWRQTDGIPADQTHQEPTLAQDAEVYLTRYWPTFATETDKYHLCVAGKGTQGDVVLEQWTFGTTSASGIQAPTVIPSWASGQSGPSYDWTLPPRIDVTTVLRLSNWSGGLIRGVIPSLLTPNQVFVYYHASSDVYVVDLTTKQQTLVASPTSCGGGCLVVADLAHAYAEFHGADYVNRGYCYFFQPGQVFDGSNVPDPLVLIDEDRDGAIDKWRLVTAAQWVSEGWHDAANILPRAF